MASLRKCIATDDGHDDDDDIATSLCMIIYREEGIG